MKKQSDFKVVSAPVSAGVLFSETVNRMLDAGYALHGNLAVRDGQLFQAVVIEKEVSLTETSAPKIQYVGDKVEVAPVGTEPVVAKKKGRPKKEVTA